MAMTTTIMTTTMSMRMMRVAGPPNPLCVEVSG
jgi:hypothetical protein